MSSMSYEDVVFNKETLSELKAICERSSKVVAWYDHYETVRGPWNRWFTCTGTTLIVCCC